ncbi:MAG: hypothetical protein ChlgKO_11170 [Chlamydiales bacterium]
MIETAKAKALSWYNAATKENAQKLTLKIVDFGKANPLKASGIVVLTGLASISLYKLLFGKDNTPPSGTSTT